MSGHPIDALRQFEETRLRQRPENVTHSLMQEAEAAQLLLEQMRDIVADDEQATRDLIEGQTGFHEAVAAAVRRIGEDETAMAAIKAYADKLDTRSARLKQRVQNIRTAIAVAMGQTGQKKIETPLGTVSLKAIAPSAIVAEEADIPQEFWKPQPPKLDKAELLRALKGGREIAGAMLSNGGQTIAIKV